MLRNERRGITALEYGLITAVIGGVVLVGVVQYGNALTSSYNVIGNVLNNQVNSVRN